MSRDFNWIHAGNLLPLAPVCLRSGRFSWYYIACYQLDLQLDSFQPF